MRCNPSLQPPSGQSLMHFALVYDHHDAFEGSDVTFMRDKGVKREI